MNIEFKNHKIFGIRTAIAINCLFYLDAHSAFNRKGDPKVYVTPGFTSGGSSAEAMVALRARIREVGVLWNRLDPGQNSDFSTHYPEKYQP